MEKTYFFKTIPLSLKTFIAKIYDSSLTAAQTDHRTPTRHRGWERTASKEESGVTGAVAGGDGFRTYHQN